MIPDGATSKILESGGVWGALLIAVSAVLGTVIIVLWKRLEASEAARIKESQECSEQERESFESRIADARSLAVVTEKCTATMLALMSSSELRAVAITEMSKGFTILSENYKSDRSLREQSDRLLAEKLEQSNRSLSDQLGRLERLVEALRRGAA